MEPKGDEAASVTLHQRSRRLDHPAEEHAVLRKRHRGTHRVDTRELPAAAGFTTTATADQARKEKHALAAAFLTDVLGSLQGQ